jgi:hypothetical protein
MRNMDEYRLEFRQYYIVSSVMTSIVGLCLLIIYILPMYTNKVYFYNPDNITDGDIMNLKGLYGAVNVFLIVAWLLATAFNKASISDMDMDPEEMDENENADDTMVSSE